MSLDDDVVRHADNALRWADRAFALAMFTVWVSLIPAFASAMRLLKIQLDPSALVVWMAVTALVIYLVWFKLARSHRESR